LRHRHADDPALPAPATPHRAPKSPRLLIAVRWR
jgi:hypothetical protein